MRMLKTPAILLFALSVISSVSMAQIDIPRCPVKIGNQTILDSKTPFIGPAACDALKDADRLADALNKGVRKYQEDAAKDIRDLNKVMFDDAINKNAIKKFNKAADAWNTIMDDVKDLAEDEQCGVEGVYKGLNSFFVENVKTLQNIASIARETGNTVNQLKPVVAELGKISSELARIASIAGAKSPEAKKQFDIIKSSIDSIQKDMQTISAMDAAVVIKDGTDLAATITPFMVDCGSCASALAASVGSLAASATAVTAGTGGCPETAVAFGGSCWATVAGVPTGALSVTLGPLLSNAACQNVASSTLRYQQYYTSIDRFVSTLFKLSNNIINNADDVAKASAALSSLAKELGNESQGSIKNIQQSMDVMTDALEATHTYAYQQLRPRLNNGLKDIVRNIARSIRHVNECYNTYVAVANQLTPQALSAAQNLLQASTTLVNTNKVLDNMADQSQKAVEAASNSAKDGYERIDSRFASLHRTLFGQSPVRDFTKIDVAKASGAIAALVADEKKRDKAFDKAEDLLRDITALPNSALNAGKNAFLDRDAKKNTVKQNLADVERRSQAALTELTKVAPKKVQEAREDVEDVKKEAIRAAKEKAKRKMFIAAARKTAVQQLETQAPIINVVDVKQSATPPKFTKFKTK